MTNPIPPASGPSLPPRDSGLLHEAERFYRLMKARRSTRRFTKRRISTEVLSQCILTAGTAPSGANSQPWFFALVTGPELKSKIRKLAEQEELQFYRSRASDEFLADLKPLGTNWKKPHLEEASALIVVFAKIFEIRDGRKKNCYYPKESVGIATGMLITALHRLGIATLTHTPSPMKFLNEILDRPLEEKPFLILAAGYKAKRHPIPTLSRKEIQDICKIY